MTETFKAVVTFTKDKNWESWLVWSGAIGGRENVFGDFRGKHKLLAMETCSEGTV